MQSIRAAGGGSSAVRKQPSAGRAHGLLDGRDVGLEDGEAVSASFLRQLPSTLSAPSETR